MPVLNVPHGAKAEPVKTKPKMTLAQALKVLRAHNEWRRGGGEMLDPRDVGNAIDTACAALEKHLARKKTAA